MKPEQMEAMKRKITEIARNELHLDTLETRRSDRLDFSDQAIWNIAEALELAYLAGMSAVKTEAES